MSLMVEAKMAAPLSTSCLQRWTLLQEAAQCSGVLQGWDVAVFVVGVSGEEVRSCSNLEKRHFNNDLQMTCS